MMLAEERFERAVHQVIRVIAIKVRVSVTFIDPCAATSQNEPLPAFVKHLRGGGQQTLAA